MRILRVLNDIERYQYFLPKEAEAAKSLLTDGYPKGETWQPPEVYIPNPSDKIGALYNYGRDCLIFSPSVAKLIWDYLFIAGEDLPLPYKDEVYTFLNVTECINCLDVARSEWHSYDPKTKRGDIKKYVFYPTRVPESPLFKIPNSLGEVFVKDGYNMLDEDFFNMLKDNNVEGIIFDEVWRSDDHDK